MVRLRILGVAVVSRHVAYACLDGDKLVDWCISDAASGSPAKAASAARRWIDMLDPNVVVTEAPATARYKGKKSKRLITPIGRTAAKSPVIVLVVERERPFKNKYEEAADLGKTYPEVAPWVPPKRRIQDNEPRNAVLFEALALADQVRRQPTIGLAAALG